MVRVASSLLKSAVLVGAVLVASSGSAMEVQTVSVPATAVPKTARMMDGPQWRDTVRALGIDPDSVVQPFVVTPEMQKWAQRVTSGVTSPLVRLSRLQHALFADEFTYDPDLTPTAEETFTGHRGNCMAFSVLFVALSRSVGLKTYVLSVPRVEDVNKEGDLVVVSRHVLAGFPVADRLYLYDFYLSIDSLGSGYQILDDLTVAALFQSNNGVALLRAGDDMAALEQFEITTSLIPEMPSAWVNLGVVRRRLDDIQGALEAYHNALELDPGDSSALTNLAALYHQLGREKEARSTLAAAVRDSNSPYTLVALAALERAHGNHETANQLMRRARRLASGEPEIYEALARWAEESGDQQQAVRYRAKAKELAAARDKEHGTVKMPGLQ